MIFDFHNTDLITRTFVKDRGAPVDYKFQTRAKIFNTTSDPSRPNLSKLNSHLIEVFLEGYKEQEKGCSNSSIHLMATVRQVTEPSEILQLMKTIDYHGRGRGQHDFVQDAFMQRDPCTVACELPVWSEVTRQSGFIDIVRYKNEQVILADFKPPNAGKEDPRKVGTQLLIYKDLLHRNTGIPKDDIHLCYFCENRLFSVTN